ncbi:hypothetical protein F5J12DRAFT_779161 [Pisolithus orientalis]|uniref:uncharacterized protein n=1 Tax=Pisolithus orientalis TaxID=936130 RepID=UPI0022254A0A|nr:uncharacterized protein F5J12DRAFT_779161 [Pisolithus orientalis]KAI6032714.1 hypothetical protein F5J12DRAFT_779161 [Pisolithus orientalis]
MAAEQHAVGSSKVQEVKMLQNEHNCAPAIPQESYQGWCTLKSLPDDKAREPGVPKGTRTCWKINEDIKASETRLQTGPTSTKTAKSQAYPLDIESQPREASDKGSMQDESSTASVMSNDAVDTLRVEMRMLAGSSIQYYDRDWTSVLRCRCGCIKFEVLGRASAFKGIKRLFEVLGTVMPIAASIESETLNKGQGINADASKWYLKRTMLSRLQDSKDAWMAKQYIFDFTLCCFRGSVGVK